MAEIWPAYLALGPDAIRARELFFQAGLTRLDQRAPERLLVLD